MDTETSQNELRESKGSLKCDKKGKIGRKQEKMGKPKHSKLKVL